MSSASQAPQAVEARVDSIMEYCMYSVKKTKMLSTALVQLISLAILISLSFLQAPPSTALTIFDGDRLLDHAQAQSVTRAEDAVSWFVGVAQEQYVRRAANNTANIDGTVPILMCTFRSFIPSGLQHGSRATSDASCDVPSQLRALPASIYSGPLATICATQGPGNRTTFAEFYFTDDDDIADSIGRLSTLQATAWATADTQVEGEFLFYTNSEDLYTYMKGSFNPRTGSLTTFSQPFQLSRLDTTRGVIELILLILFALSTLFTLWLIFKAVKLLHELEGDWGGATSAKNMYDLLYVALSTWYLVMAFQSVYKGRRLSSGLPGLTNDRAVFAYLVNLQHHQRTQEVVMAWTLITSVLRPLFYMQYVTRFSAVSETIVSSLPSLAGCALVFILIVITFAITGQQLYGDSIFGLRSIEGTLTFLFVLVFREGSVDYTPYFHAAPVSGVIFFLLFACLTQVVVLNIVVGVIASSFSASISTMELVRNPNWSLHDIGKDLIRFVRRYAVRLRFGNASGSGVSDHLVFIQDRLDILEALRERRKSALLKKDAMLTERQLQVMVPNVSAKTVRVVVQKAAHHIGTSDAVLRQSRTTMQRMSRTERMEKQLWGQIKTVTELHKIFIEQDDDKALAKRQVSVSAADNEAANALTQQQVLLQEVVRIHAAVERVNSGMDAFGKKLQATDRDLTKLEEEVSKISS